jgi:DNA-binding NarL/FixJ family response regulator
MGNLRGHAFHVAADGSGMDIREIAKRLGVSHGTVWFDLQSAFSKLRRYPGFMDALQELARINKQARQTRDSQYAD